MLGNDHFHVRRRERTGDHDTKNDRAGILDMISAEVAAPCRHVGSPPESVVAKTAELIKDLGREPELLAKYGLSAQEYTGSLNAAIESVRGSMSASNADRRNFVSGILEHLVELGLASSFSQPAYGDDTVYRVEVPGLGSVAIIQKGCPDGAHSSASWSVPSWAEESYLWWLCSSMRMHPGEHVTKGVGRLRQQFFADRPDSLSGVIFHNQLCGSSQRPCPKSSRSIEINGHLVPPPCVYLLPSRDEDSLAWNWQGDTIRRFPALLLSAFHVEAREAEVFTGFVGFQRKSNGALRTTITTRSGAGRSSTFRSKA